MVYAFNDIQKILTCLFSETSCTTPHHLQKLHITENSSILLEFRVYIHISVSTIDRDINARIYDTEYTWKFIFTNHEYNFRIFILFCGIAICVWLNLEIENFEFILYLKS